MKLEGKKLLFAFIKAFAISFLGGLIAGVIGYKIFGSLGSCYSCFLIVIGIIFCIGLLFILKRMHEKYRILKVIIIIYLIDGVVVTIASLITMLRFNTLF